MIVATIIVGMGALTIVALALVRGARQADERLTGTSVLSAVPRERRDWSDAS